MLANVGTFRLQPARSTGSDSGADISPSESQARSRCAKLSDDESSLVQPFGSRYLDCTLHST